MNEIVPFFQSLPGISVIVTFVVAVGVLFYRTAQLEKRFEEMSNADRVDHAAFGKKIDVLADHLQDFQIQVVSTYVPKEDINRMIGRIEGKIDTLTDTIIKNFSHQK